MEAIFGAAISKNGARNITEEIISWKRKGQRIISRTVKILMLKLRSIQKPGNILNANVKENKRRMLIIKVIESLCETIKFKQ